jgi:AcrR family transcriptional regulator
MNCNSLELLSIKRLLDFVVSVEQNSNMTNSKTHTRDRLLNAAELLFDLNGVDVTTTRQIAAAIAVNSAAPNFHFGSKSNLIREVFQRRMIPLVKRRLELLQMIEEPNITNVIDSFVDPLAELAREADENKNAFLRLLARNTLAPCKEFTDLLNTEFKEYTNTYALALRHALPELTAGECQARFDLTIGAIAQAHRHDKGLQDKRRVQRLKTYVIAGLTTN